MWSYMMYHLKNILLKLRLIDLRHMGFSMHSPHKQYKVLFKYQIFKDNFWCDYVCRNEVNICNDGFFDCFTSYAGKK